MEDYSIEQVLEYQELSKSVERQWVQVEYLANLLCLCDKPSWYLNDYGDPALNLTRNYLTSVDDDAERSRIIDMLRPPGNTNPDAYPWLFPDQRNALVASLHNDTANRDRLVKDYVDDLKIPCTSTEKSLLESHFKDAMQKLDDLKDELQNLDIWDKLEKDWDHDDQYIVKKLSPCVAGISKVLDAKLPYVPVFDIDEMAEVMKRKKPEGCSKTQKNVGTFWLTRHNINTIQELVKILTSSENLQDPNDSLRDVNGFQIQYYASSCGDTKALDKPGLQVHIEASNEPGLSLMSYRVFVFTIALDIPISLKNQRIQVGPNDEAIQVGGYTIQLSNLDKSGGGECIGTVGPVELPSAGDGYNLSTILFSRPRMYALLKNSDVHCVFQGSDVPVGVTWENAKYTPPFLHLQGKKEGQDVVISGHLYDSGIGRIVFEQNDARLAPVHVEWGEDDIQEMGYLNDERLAMKSSKLEDKVTNLLDNILRGDPKAAHQLIGDTFQKIQMEHDMTQEIRDTLCDPSGVYFLDVKFWSIVNHMCRTNGPQRLRVNSIVETLYKGKIELDYVGGAVGGDDLIFRVRNSIEIPKDFACNLYYDQQKYFNVVTISDGDGDKVRVKILNAKKKWDQSYQNNKIYLQVKDLPIKNARVTNIDWGKKRCTVKTRSGGQCDDCPINTVRVISSAYPGLIVRSILHDILLIDKPQSFADHVQNYEIRTILALSPKDLTKPPVSALKVTPNIGDMVERYLTVSSIVRDPGLGDYNSEWSDLRKIGFARKSLLYVFQHMATESEEWHNATLYPDDEWKVHKLNDAQTKCFTTLAKHYLDNKTVVPDKIPLGGAILDTGLGKTVLGIYLAVFSLGRAVSLDKQNSPRLHVLLVTMTKVIPQFKAELIQHRRAIQGQHFLIESFFLGYFGILRAPRIRRDVTLQEFYDDIDAPATKPVLETSKLLGYWLSKVTDGSERSRVERIFINFAYKIETCFTFTTYNSFIQYIANADIYHVILDEAHNLRNDEKNMAQEVINMVRKLAEKISHVTALTATIVVNDITDMEWMCQVADPIRLFFLVQDSEQPQVPTSVISCKMREKDVPIYDLMCTVEKVLSKFAWPTRKDMTPFPFATLALSWDDDEKMHNTGIVYLVDVVIKMRFCADHMITANAKCGDDKHVVYIEHMAAIDIFATYLDHLHEKYKDKDKSLEALFDPINRQIIDGATTEAFMPYIISEFIKNPLCKIIILSKAAITGVNLRFDENQKGTIWTHAMSPIYTYSEIYQLMGRTRRGQKKTQFDLHFLEYEVERPTTKFVPGISFTLPAERQDTTVIDRKYSWNLSNNTTTGIGGYTLEIAAPSSNKRQKTRQRNVKPSTATSVGGGVDFGTEISQQGRMGLGSAKSYQALSMLVYMNFVGEYLLDKTVWSTNTAQTVAAAIKDNPIRATSAENTEELKVLKEMATMPNISQIDLIQTFQDRYSKLVRSRASLSDHDDNVIAAYFRKGQWNKNSLSEQVEDVYKTFQQTLTEDQRLLFDRFRYSIRDDNFEQSDCKELAAALEFTDEKTFLDKFMTLKPYYKTDDYYNHLLATAEKIKGEIKYEIPPLWKKILDDDPQKADFWTNYDVMYNHVLQTYRDSMTVNISKTIDDVLRKRDLQKDNFWASVQDLLKKARADHKRDFNNPLLIYNEGDVEYLCEILAALPDYSGTDALPLYIPIILSTQQQSIALFFKQRLTYSQSKNQFGRKKRVLLCHAENRFGNCPTQQTRREFLDKIAVVQDEMATLYKAMGSGDVCQFSKSASRYYCRYEISEDLVISQPKPCDKQKPSNRNNVYNKIKVKNTCASP